MEQQTTETATDAVIREAQEKLERVEDYITVTNIIISLYAIKLSWGFTKANKKFLKNWKAAMDYVDRIGVAKAYELAQKEMDIDVEFENLANYNIYEELGLNREKVLKMKLRILKKKYKKMYGKKPPEQMKKRIIKFMIRHSEFINIKAIDQNAKEYCTRVGTAEIKKVLLALIIAVRKELIEYERYTENLVNTTRILAERRKIRKRRLEHRENS